MSLSRAMSAGMGCSERWGDLRLVGEGTVLGRRKTLEVCRDTWAVVQCQTPPPPPAAKVLQSSPGRTACSELCRPQRRTGIVLPKHQPHKRKDDLVCCCDPSAYSTDRPGTEQTLSVWGPDSEWRRGNPCHLLLSGDPGGGKNPVWRLIPRACHAPRPQSSSPREEGPGAPAEHTQCPRCTLALASPPTREASATSAA